MDEFLELPQNVVDETPPYLSRAHGNIFTRENRETNWETVNKEILTLILSLCPSS